MVNVQMKCINAIRINLWYIGTLKCLIFTYICFSHN